MPWPPSTSSVSATRSASRVAGWPRARCGGRDGAWLRRPSPERIVKALGEPLVVVRRSVLMDLLAGALDEGTIESGVAATELVVTATRRPGDVVGRRRRARPTAVIGADGVGSMVARHLNGALRHRYAGYTAWRGIAEYALDPSLAGETVGAGTEFGHVPLGADHTYWFGTERRTRGQRSPPAANSPTSGRSTAAGPTPSPRCWPPPTRPTFCATTSTTASDAAPVVAWSRRPGRRRRASDAAAPRPGRLSGAWRMPRSSRTASTRPTTCRRLRTVRRVPAAAGACAGPRVQADRPDRQRRGPRSSAPRRCARRRWCPRRS